tara:strand:+ start:190 stop:420 length:231 start_codon:yes stop_codon:yes gene_type:complete
MTEKLLIDDKEYPVDEMSDQQKYFYDLIKEQQAEKFKAQKALDVIVAALIVLENNLKTSLQESKETKTETEEITES